jgi:hypothetical protein
MFIIIIIGIAGIIFGYYRTCQFLCIRPNLDDYIINSILWSILGIVLGFIIALALPAEVKIVKTTYKLETLQDNDNLKGSFFLGSGQIEGEMKFVFYYEDNNGFKLDQVDYNKVLIKYSNEDPKIEIFKQEYIKNSIINIFAIDCLGCGFYPKYIIYVPKGTIKNNYVLDTQ